MRWADRRRIWGAGLALFGALTVCLVFSVVAGATTTNGPTPTPTPASNPNQACDSSTEFTIDFDPLTCASDAAGAVASWVGDQAIHDVASWITSAAASGSASLLGLLSSEATQPELTAPWFNSVYYGAAAPAGTSVQKGSKMPGAVVIAAWLVLPIVIAAVLACVIRSDPGGIVRLLLVRLPLAILLTFVAAGLVALLLELTDLASGWVLDGGASGLQQWSSQMQSQGIGSDFLSVVACLALIVATLLGYVELMARDALLYIVVAFVPLIAAASLWPGAHNALKRAAETIFVLCVSKFVLVFVLVLGAAALTSGNVSSFSPLLTGTLIFLIAALAPATIFRLIPILEASAVAGLAGGASRFAKSAAKTGHGAVGAGLGKVSGATTRFGDRLQQGGGQPALAGAGAAGMSGSSGELQLAGRGSGERGPDGPADGGGDRGPGAAGPSVAGPRGGGGGSGPPAGGGSSGPPPAAAKPAGAPQLGLVSSERPEGGDGSSGEGRE